MISKLEHLYGWLMPFAPPPQKKPNPVTFSDEFLHKLRAGDTDEGTVGVMSNGSGQQRLPGAGRSIQQHPLQVNMREQNVITIC